MGELKFKFEDDNDEEETKFNEIVDLLVQAGYFRARINGLSKFDKIVGGMTWCIIQTCNDLDLDIDVDLLFAENSTIGAKIALTEKIVAVLGEMRCPFPLEPHQIQGLEDLEHIRPCVEWLVTKAVETRAETLDYLRSYSLTQFDKFHNLNKSEELSPFERAFEELNEIYKPKRRYRPKKKLKDGVDDMTRVELTLLEYGARAYADCKDLKDVQKQKEEEQEVNERMDLLMKGLTNCPIKRVSAKIVGGLITSENLSKYDQSLKKESLVESLKLAESKKAMLESRIAGLTREKSGLLAKIKENSEALECLKERKYDLEQSLKALVLKESDKEFLERLENIVEVVEDLKKSETEFKRQCKSENESLKRRNEAAKRELELLKDKRIDDDDDDDDDRSSELAELKEKFEKLKRILAEKSAALMKLRRYLEEAPPSRMELFQYQRRFLEIDERISSERSETEKFRILLNSVKDQRKYMEREIGILESIVDQSESRQRVQFLMVLEEMSADVCGVKDRLQARLLEKESERDSIKKQLMKLLEDHRTYTLLIRDLKEEAKKNSALQLKLQQNRLNEV